MARSTCVLRSRARRSRGVRAPRGDRREHFFTLAETDEDTFFRVLVEQVEPALAAYPRPVFLVDYPISQASLARAKPDDPRVCERFELYLGGIELCNGFGELTDPIEQRRRLRRPITASHARGKAGLSHRRTLRGFARRRDATRRGQRARPRPLGRPLPRRALRSRGVIAFPEGHL